MKLLKFLPEQASTVAAGIDNLYLTLIGISVFFSVLIAALCLWFGFKYRQSKTNPTGQPIHGNLWLEIIWTVIPLVIVMFLFVAGAKLYLRNMQPPADAMEIFVVGKQWMWKIQHPEGPREINELHVPVGQPVKLLMTSEDVIHSFYVPAFRVKMDVVPGTYTRLWFEATKPGRYHLFCAEYCGTKHSQMIGHIVAMEPSDYEKWLAERVDPERQAGSFGKGMMGKGERLFREFRCDSCHHQNSGALGPNLENLVGHSVTLENGKTLVADENYLRESILTPQAKVVAGYAPVMPTFKNQMDEEQLMAIIAYLKTLGASPEEGPKES